MTRRCTYIACIVWRGTATIVRANEFRNFAWADVIWDNARIACTPGTDSARLAPQPVSGQWRTSTSVNAIVANRAAIGDTETGHVPRNCDSTRANVLRGEIYYNAPKHILTFLENSLQHLEEMQLYIQNN